MSDDHAGLNVKAPWHLWLVGGLMLLWNAFGAMDFLGTTTMPDVWLKQTLGYPDDQIAFFQSFPWWQYVLWGVGTWGAFLGTILLLMRKKIAVVFLGASLVGAIGSMIHGMSLKDLPDGMDPGAMPFVIIAIATLLFLYSVWMSRRGVLR